MVNLTARDQQIYNKILGTKSKSMSIDALYAEFAGVPKAAVMASCSQLLQQQLLSSEKGKDGSPIFKAKSLEEAKKTGSATWTSEQRVVHGLIKEAQRNGLSLSNIRKKVAAVSMNPVILRKALEGLVKQNIIKTFKPINSPTMTMYILAGLNPPEEVTGGVWYNANQGYDTALVHSLCQVLLKRTRDLTFPKTSEKQENAPRPNLPIHAFTKARLPSPQSLLNFIKDKRLTTAPLTVKNVMECMRALELDGKVETIKPLSMGHFDLGDDEPGPSKRRKVDSDGDSSEDDSRKEKERQKAKERAKEKKRKAREKEKKEKKKKEKEKKKRKKEKEREKEKEKKKKRKKKDKKRSESDGDDSDALQELGDEDAPKKRKRAASVSSSSSSSSSSDSDSDSDSGSDSGSESVSSVDSDDIDENDVAFKPISGSDLPAMMSNPFDLADTQIVYRATRRLDNSIMLGQMQTPCGRCPQFTFCEEQGPVNASECKYYDAWLADGDGAGGWERGTALDKMRPGFRETDEDMEAIATKAAAANGSATNGHDANGGEMADEGMEVDANGDAGYGEGDEGDDQAEAYDN